MDLEKNTVQINNRVKRMAVCYDFDKTLSPDNMQTFSLIPSFEIEKEEFWKKSNALAKENLMNNNLAWMFELVEFSRFKNKPLRREYFKEIGAKVKLYKGVKTWFNHITEYARKRGLELEHYIISSGLKEIIEGSDIAPEFKRIYASSYLYNIDGVVIWPAQAINYTNKTQYIFRIAKGFLEEYDERVNKSIPEEQLRIPYENIVYIGDSDTDIPCMRLVKSRGGYSIGVFDPVKDNRVQVYELFNDERLSFYAPADYSKNGELMRYMKQIIDEIAARENIKTEQIMLRQPAELYQLTVDLRRIEDDYPNRVSSKVKKELQKLSEKIEKMIPGNLE